MAEKKSNAIRANVRRRNRLSSFLQEPDRSLQFCDEEDDLRQHLDIAASLLTHTTSHHVAPIEINPVPGEWEGAFRSAMGLVAAKQRDAIRLQKLEERVEELAKQIKNCGAIHVSITSLAPEPYELLKPIQVVVQPNDAEFIASFFDANVNASGDTETDAVANLKEIMLSVFAYLIGQPEGRLGIGPRRQVAVLREFIRRR
jgi:hypothetical protein